MPRKTPEHLSAEFERNGGGGTGNGEAQLPWREGSGTQNFTAEIDKRKLNCGNEEHNQNKGRIFRHSTKEIQSVRS